MYPQEQLRRSKMRGFDEGLLLDHPVFLSLSPLLHAMRSRAGSSGDLWSFVLNLVGSNFCLRRTKYAYGIEGNGLELWRRPVARYEGCDELAALC